MSRKPDAGTPGFSSPSGHITVVPLRTTPTETGPPPEFSLAQRALVRDLTLWGVPLAMITKHIYDPRTGSPLSVYFLKKYFEHEVAEGMAQAGATLSRLAWAIAMGKPAEYNEHGQITAVEIPPNVGMLMMQCKHRLRWGKDEPEATKETASAPDEDGAEMTIRARVGSLSYEEKSVIRNILQRRIAGEPESEPETDE